MRRHRLRLVPRSRLLLLGLAVSAVLFIVGSVVVAKINQNTAETATAVVEDQRDATAAQARQAIDPVLQLCAQNDEVARALHDRGACDLAERVEAEPIPGIQGLPGEPGRGITGTSLTPGGRLVVSYTDGTSADLGVVVGAPGADGAPGRGITGTFLESGRLVVAFTDGDRADLGPVVGSDGADGANGDDGADGRGVASVGQVDGRLIVTFTDGTNQDAGPLPAGPPGTDGQPGQGGGQGAQGIGVTAVRAEERDGQCLLIFVLTDPATQISTEQELPVGDAVCADDDLLEPN